ncbi:MAG: DEAD/DEAH box helicase [Oligoflexia bacterium]|nr:DEAD/DEAH box helicase [Oligoflexia bacterium]
MDKELQLYAQTGNILQFEYVDGNTQISSETRLFQDEIHKRASEDFSRVLLFMSFSDPGVQVSATVFYWRDLCFLFKDKLVTQEDIEEKRGDISLELTDEELDGFVDKAPYAIGHEYINRDFVLHVWSMLVDRYISEINNYKGTVSEFIKSFSADIHLPGKIYFHLVENRDSDVFPFAFLATYSAKTDSGGTKHLPLSSALSEYENDNEKLLELLSTVTLVAEKSDLIAGILDSGEIFHPLSWTSGEAYTFLKELELYGQSGILCRVPDWWRKKSAQPKLNISFGDVTGTRLNGETLLNFNIDIKYGEMSFTRQEAEEIMARSGALSMIKGKWVEVDKNRLRQLLDAFDKTAKTLGEMSPDGLFSINEIMRMQLAGNKLISSGTESDLIEISGGSWMKDVVRKLKNPKLIRAASVSKNIKGTLREYQKDGLNWLCLMHSLDLGCCVADDMGLGKTLQVLTFLDYIKTGKPAKTPGSPDEISSSLLILPASLLQNWENEIHKFLPGLSYFTAHPGYNRDFADTLGNREILKKYDLIMTTYSLVNRTKEFNAHKWNYIILDEAQAIKNPGAKQTRAVKNLRSKNRIILTGTPIENRLSDLWSVYDFINPGLLGTASEFAEFTGSLKNNSGNYKKLKDVITPYMLRRLKTDRNIITDLPDKIEMKSYCDLSEKQIILYRKLVDDIKSLITDSDVTGIQRKGLILSSITRFKQLCNHPSQYLNDGSYEERDSGKYLKLREICDLIYQKRERVLVFTQFKEIISELDRFLCGIFERRGLNLHGGTSVPKRKELIQKFQSKEYLPYFILSVKAGGVGLNLTGANHVIHFDRWWNPAVENQATDRAFRIGQNKNVIVHKFITRGTIEEKIDKIIDEKSNLSKNIIQSTPENWITELGNDELMHMFKLSI